jgi:hypothetical protein
MFGNWRSEFREFVKENRERHEDVARKIGEVHSRVDEVHSRVNRVWRWSVGMWLAVSGTVILLLLGALGWFIVNHPAFAPRGML